MANKKQAQTPALVEQDIVGQVIEMGNGFEIDIPQDINEIKRRIIKAEVTNVLSAVEAGVYYNHLKNTLEHGEYLQFIKDVGIPRRRASEQIAVSKLFQKLNGRTSAHLTDNQESSDNNSQSVSSHFNLSQLIELTQLPEQQLETLDPPKLEEFAAMPVKQLRLAIKEMCVEHNQEQSLQTENERLKKQVKEMDLQYVAVVNELNEEQLKKAPESLYTMPAALAEIQSEAPALSEELAHVVTKLSHMVLQLCDGMTDHDRAASAASAVAVFMTGPFMHLHYALDRLKQFYPDQVGGDMVNLPEFTEAHWNEARHRREAIIDKFEQRAGHLDKRQARKRELRRSRG